MATGQTVLQEVYAAEQKNEIVTLLGTMLEEIYQRAEENGFVANKKED